MKFTIFGHFGEFNDGLMKLVKSISESEAKQHHRELGGRAVPQPHQRRELNSPGVAAYARGACRRA